MKIGFLQGDPIIMAAVAAKVSQTPFEKGSIQDLYNECQAAQEESRNLVNRVLKSQHLIFGDFLNYAVTLEDISRFAAIYLWRNVNVHNLIFGAGIEASFRVIKPNRYNQAVSGLGETAFETYQKCISLDVPEQDARYLLPEGTLTRMIFSAPARYLLKLAHSLQKSPLAELKEIGTGLAQIVAEKFGFVLPDEPLPSEWQFWGKEEIKEGLSLDYTGKSHSLSLSMGIKGSLAMYAQLVRQRQLLCDIEPLEGIAANAKFIIPSTMPESVKQDYRAIAQAAHQKQLELLAKKDPSFVYFLLLGQEAAATIYGKGAGVIETAKSRVEGVAQWEIRNVVGIPLTRKLAKLEGLARKVGPRCWREGICIEPPTFKTKKAICPSFAKSGGKWQGSLDELMDILEEPYQRFTL